MGEMTKVELEAIKEQLNLEKMLTKRFREYALMSKDPKLSEKCQQIAGEHKNHYDSLKKCLE